MMKGEWKRSVKHVKQPRNPRRLVVKLGTSTLTRETGSLNLQNMDHLARVLAHRAADEAGRRRRGPVQDDAHL